MFSATAKSWRTVGLLGVASIFSYLGILLLSFRFASPGEPPILATLSLFGAAWLCYALALAWVGRRTRIDGQAVELPLTVPVILILAVAFRLLMLFSWPIQEIDYYRYLWDGRVTLAGLNPYHYSPQEIDDWGFMARPSSELALLWQQAELTESVNTIFNRVHYRGVPTAYPPISQAVFAFAVGLTPDAAPVYVHIVVWKAVLLLFDGGTIWLLVLLLRRLRLHPAWCLAYAWCPLAMKEFANSGHFDAIAIFFTVLTAFFLVRMQQDARPPALPAVFALTSLALAVLAKSYPVLLLPVVLAYMIGCLRWRAIMPMLIFPVVIVLGYLPFASGSGPANEMPELPEQHNPGTGLGTFLTQWEMNDFLFMLVHENLRRPPREGTDRWFVWLPQTWREAWHHELVEMLGVTDLSPHVNPAFLVTQGVMGLLLLSLCLYWAWKTYRQPTPEVMLRFVFLSLAWGWLMSSAANPWYLLWCVPFMPFAGRRSWYLLTGLAFLYYVRPLMYWDGTYDAFDFGLVWLEYMPFLVALAVETWKSSRIEEPLELKPPDRED